MVDRLVRELEQAQNQDGGWPYRQGKSWTEPTCFAVLALKACQGSPGAQLRGRQWLSNTQRQDGGWAPQPSIPISTWVTSLALMALMNSRPAEGSETRAVGWIKAQTGSQRSGIEGLRKWFMGGLKNDAEPEGWSFFPGTASWVMPTVLAIVVLLKCPDARRDPVISARVAAGQRFLMSRRCADGGWNHGGSLVRGADAASYPETTGMALLALQGLAPGNLQQPIKLAEKWLARAESVEAGSWIRIALSAHGRAVPASGKLNARCWTNYDRSLFLLAEASQCGTNEFATALA